MAEHGALLTARDNIRKYLYFTKKEADDVVRDFLRFESRYALENYWIARQDRGKIEGAFLPRSVKDAESLIDGDQCIICTLHSANMFLMTALLQLIYNNVSMMLSLIPEHPVCQGPPIHLSGWNMILEWKKWQKLTKASMEAARKALNQGYSLVMACDTPPNRERGVIVNMWERSFIMPAGAAKLASEFKLPLVMLVPWASGCTAPYRIEGERFEPGAGMHEVMQKVFEVAEATILLNPACWLGWLYISGLEREKVS